MEILEPLELFKLFTLRCYSFLSNAFRLFHPKFRNTIATILLRIHFKLNQAKSIFQRLNERFDV